MPHPVELHPGVLARWLRGSVRHGRSPWGLLPWVLLGVLPHPLPAGRDESGGDDALDRADFRREIAPRLSAGVRKADRRAHGTRDRGGDRSAAGGEVHQRQR